MRFLVTGAKGQLGYDLVKELEKEGFTDIIALGRDELDITDREKVISFIKDKKPDIVFHCAAYTSVDMAEEDEESAYRINTIGTKNIVDASKEVHSKVIYISTDYVFSGNKEGIYEIDDIKIPKSTYGLTKYYGEEIVRNYSKHFIVRISWVFGINGKNFVKTMLKLSETKNEVCVVCDQIGSPTYTVDLAKLLIKMAQTEKFGIYHITNEGYCSFAEFAEEIFKINKKGIKVKHIKSAEYKQKAKRPLNSKLSKKSLLENGFTLLPTWQDALERFSKELEESE